MQKLQNLVTENRDKSLNISEQIEKYFIHWKWIVAGALLSLLLAFLYIRYTVPMYKASASILVKDESKGGVQSELQAFSDLGLLTGVKSNVDNEIQILKSRTVIEKSLKKLNFDLIYFEEARVKDVELYNESPVKLVILNNSAKVDQMAVSYVIKAKDSTSFELSIKDKNTIGTFSYGAVIPVNSNQIIVNKTTHFAIKVDKNFVITVYKRRLKDVVEGYRSRLAIAPLNKNTNVVELSVNDPMRKKSRRFIKYNYSNLQRRRDSR